MEDRYFKIVSRDTGKAYEVWFKSGRWSCSCPHWMFRLRKTGAQCKHIEDAKNHDKRQAEIQDELERNWDKLDWSWDEKPPKPDLYEDEDD